MVHFDSLTVAMDSAGDASGGGGDAGAAEVEII